MTTAPTETEVQLRPLRFRPTASYGRLAPTFVCDSVSGLSETVRWALDFNLVVYREESHAPRYSVEATNQKTGIDGTGSNPVLESTDSLVYTAESILQRLDQANPPNRKLFPDDPVQQQEVVRLFHLFTEQLYTSVNRYVFSELLPHRKYALALLTQRARWTERLGCRTGYGFLSSAISAQWRLDEQPKEEYLIEVQEIFRQVGELLQDGRKYLAGDTLTAADVAFASVGAMVTLPVEYGGAITRLNEIPFELRNEVIQLRATPAGQFILRLYQDDRPVNLPWTVPKEPGFLKRMLTGLKAAVLRQQPTAFSFLQRFFPILNVWFVKLTLIARHDLVVQALERNEDFTIEEINGRKMAFQKGAFFLGMDRNNPQFQRERDFVLQATRKDDVAPIREFFRSRSEEITRAAEPWGRLDVASSLCYVVLNRLLGDYFGVPGPTNSTMQRWCLDLFYDLFFNFTSNAKIHANAVTAANERNAWTMNLIRDRKQDLKDGHELDDNLLNRLIILSQQPGYEWVSDMTICRNIGGLLTGAFGTTNKGVILALDQLFRRPDQLRGAVAAAQAFDMDRVAGYVSESLRFSPVQPGVLRYCENEQFLPGAGNKKYRIKGGRKIVALTAGAMFDPVTFPDPKTFRPDRDARYMNWGFGLHECYGGFINRISFPEFVGAVLRLPNVRRAAGREGQGTGLNQGPFPNFFVVEFDARPEASG